ncbi:MAG: site-2 protease family protein [Candidatus Nezhaarchaeota archaeon]|nr:site-2 protease family protein [Candidatus Nezhaarchaeota archaeon]MCX8141839.1 site-2 protease family protein [Candidatus Nezhaarchaeota archaeon]MDW8050380.1 site-2 protease family protein [Nitrososphaerota archaeon]
MKKFPVEIDDLVRHHFTVIDWKIQYGVLTYTVGDENTKHNYLNLYSKLAEKGYVPILRWEGDKRVLRVIVKPPQRKHKLLWNILLFLVTITTVTFAGYLFTSSGLYEVLDPSFPLYRNLHLLAYVASIFFVLGAHELGHKFACFYHKVKSTPPYFIPGPPEIGGSLGAVMIQETPILNRDQLFDLGLFGPLLGFTASIIVTLLGLSLSYVVPHDVAATMLEQGQISVLPTEPLLFTLIRDSVALYLKVPADQGILLHPIAFAGWVGMLITFLNTLPVGQLDGGHVTRALFGSSKHAKISLVAVVIMLITGFIVMAMISLLIFFRGHPGPLDDVSPPSRSRRVTFFLLPLICGLCFTSITFKVL